MPNIDLSILNQRQTPAFYADVFANRPAAGFVGRIFVSTDTYAFYRDNGTSWDLIGGPGTGTVTGTGANGQVTFWNGASTITGSNDLFWDATNGHFGVNTNAPGTALDVHHDQPTVGILNQTVATNDTRIAFQNSGVAKWRVGNFYNLGSNDYAVNDATLNINRFTIKSSSGQTFVGDETTSSGLFVVNNSSGDAHIVALGATAPSIRVRNAGVGASLQFGLGLATTTNNFIQGATGGEFCIFNDSLTAQPILFGIKDAGLGNTQEAARISAARNFLIGTTTDAGFKLQVSGTSNVTGVATFNSNVGIGVTPATIGNYKVLNIQGNSTSQGGLIQLQNSDNTVRAYWFNTNTNATLKTVTNHDLILGANNTDYLYITSAGYLVLGASTSVYGQAGRGTFEMNGSADNILAMRIAGSLAAYLYTSATGLEVYSTNITTFSTNGSERARITTGGNLLIGTTTDNGNKLQVNGLVNATALLLNGSYNTTIATNGSWTSFQTIVPTGTFSPYNTCIVSIHWTTGVGNQPYEVSCSFLWTPAGTNGGSADNSFTPICSTHTGGSGTISFRSIAGSPFSTSGLQAQLNGFADNTGSIIVKVSVIQTTA